LIQEFLLEFNQFYLPLQLLRNKSLSKLAKFISF